MLKTYLTAENLKSFYAPTHDKQNVPATSKLWSHIMMNILHIHIRYS